MSAVLQELGPTIRVLRSEGGVDELEIDLPALQADDAQSAPRRRMERLLRLIAEKLVSWVPSRVPR